MSSISVVPSRAWCDLSGASIRRHVLCLCGMIDVTSGKDSLSLLAREAGFGCVALASLLW